MKDDIKINGSVSVIRVIDRSGVEVPVSSILVDPAAGPVLGPNLVVDGGRTALARLLGGDLTDYQVSDVSFGTGDSPPKYNDLTLSPQPDGVFIGGENEIEISTGVTRKAIAEVQYPGPYLVQFRFALDYSEANGVVIREVGLWTSGGALFARKSFPGLIKSADNRIELAWTLRC